MFYLNYKMVYILLDEKMRNKSNYKMVYSLLDERMRNKLIGVDTGKSLNMVGRFSGAVDRMELEREKVLYPVWCSYHQLYLAVQTVFQDHVKNPFVNI